MPGPPPPPPAAPPPMMPPPPTFSPSKGGSDDRGALLKSIRQGAKLKKTVTVDKSAPLIAGKVSGSSTSSNSNNSLSTTNSSTPMTNGLGLGGLFAGGMPKLRPTGRQLGDVPDSSNVSNSQVSNNSNRNQNVARQKSPDVPAQPQNNFNNIQNQLKKQLANNENTRNRGPPPPAPVRHQSDDLPSPRQPFVLKNGSSNGVHHQSQSVINLNALHANTSTLHRKVSSNLNISTSVDSSYSSTNNNKPVISHGKPNLAPKPPVLNGKPAAPPKKLMINGKPVGRAQSMKSPHPPPPQSPDNNNSAAKFGTVRNLTSVIGNSLAASTGNLTQRPRPAINMRPNGPPPSIPQLPPQPLPPNKMSAVKPPSHAPPPPPTMLPQPPSQAPPPPPHKTQAPQVPSRAPPAIPTNNGCAPPPPPRHSSIRGDGVGNNTSKGTSSPVELEARYEQYFHSITEFPRPTPYRRIFKVYPSQQVGSKQPAPQPPQLQLPAKTWDASAC